MNTPRLAPHALLLALTAIGIAGCSNLGTFTITEESAEAIVDGGGGLTGLLPTADLLPALNLDIDLEEELAAQDADGAKAVYLTDLDLQITDTAQPDGDEDDFDFVDSVEVYVASRKEGSSLVERQIATLSDVPEGQTLVSFDVDDSVDLKPYIEEGMTLTTRGSGEVPPDDTSFKAIVTLDIEVL